MSQAQMISNSSRVVHVTICHVTESHFQTSQGHFGERANWTVNCAVNRVYVLSFMTFYEFWSSKKIEINYSELLQFFVISSSALMLLSTFFNRMAVIWALLLLFGPCHLSEFTPAGPLLRQMCWNCILCLYVLHLFYFSSYVQLMWCLTRFYQLNKCRCRCTTQLVLTNAGIITMIVSISVSWLELGICEP